MKKKSIIILLALALIGVLIYFGLNQKGFKSGEYTNMYDKDSKAAVLNAVNKAGIKDTALFSDLVARFNRAMNDDCGLSKGFGKLNERNYDDDAIGEAYAVKYPTLPDINCRIAAFSLIKDIIKADNNMDYDTYLMLDIENIEKDGLLLPIKKEMGKYISLFNEVDVSKLKTDDEFKNAFINQWNKRGVVFPTGNISIINVVIHDPMGEILFVGHTGVLVKEKDKLIFIEKLSFNKPYQVAIFNNMDELKMELQSRSWYPKEEGARENIIYENNKIIN